MNHSYGMYTTVDDRDLTRAASDRYALLQIAAERRPARAPGGGAGAARRHLRALSRIRLGSRGRVRTDAA